MDKESFDQVSFAASRRSYRKKPVIASIQTVQRVLFVCIFDMLPEFFLHVLHSGNIIKRLFRSFTEPTFLSHHLLYCHPPKTYWRLQCFHFLTLDVFPGFSCIIRCSALLFPIYEVHKNPLDFPSEAILRQHSDASEWSSASSDVYGSAAVLISILLWFFYILSEYPEHLQIIIYTHFLSSALLPVIKSKVIFGASVSVSFLRPLHAGWLRDMFPQTVRLQLSGSVLPSLFWNTSHKSSPVPDNILFGDLRNRILCFNLPVLQSEETSSLSSTRLFVSRISRTLHITDPLIFRGEIKPCYCFSPSFVITKEGRSWILSEPCFFP